MDLVRHWIAERTVMGTRHVRVLSDGDVPRYAAEGNWNLSGPFVPEAQQPQGAVAALEAIRDEANATPWYGASDGLAEIVKLAEAALGIPSAGGQ